MIRSTKKVFHSVSDNIVYNSVNNCDIKKTKEYFFAVNQIFYKKVSIILIDIYHSYMRYFKKYNLTKFEVLSIFQIVSLPVLNLNH